MGLNALLNVSMYVDMCVSDTPKRTLKKLTFEAVTIKLGAVLIAPFHCTQFIRFRHLAPYKD